MFYVIMVNIKRLIIVIHEKGRLIYKGLLQKIIKINAIYLFLK